MVATKPEPSDPFDPFTSPSRRMTALAYLAVPVLGDRLGGSVVISDGELLELEIDTAPRDDDTTRRRRLREPARKLVVQERLHLRRRELRDRDATEPGAGRRHASPVGKLTTSGFLLMCTRRYHRGGGKASSFGGHRLRHGIASHLIEQGVDLALVQDLMGHVDPKTTRRYTHPSVDAMRKRLAPVLGAELLGPW